jgi:hypothetical protein
MTSPDWLTWHQPYNDPDSSLSHRLLRVQHRLIQALDAQQAGPIRVLSMCAGQGRDLIGPLAQHPRRSDVRALLVEADPRNTAVATTHVRAAGLEGIDVVTGDASISSAYAKMAPADIALVCGVFGNISDHDIRRTIQHLPDMVRTGATVIWTRHRKNPDLTPAIRNWFAEAGFTQLGFDTEEGYLYGVGTQILTGAANSFQPDVELFSFERDGAEANL